MVDQVYQCEDVLKKDNKKELPVTVGLTLGTSGRAKPTTSSSSVSVVLICSWSDPIAP
jgi:hypothetical protein